MDIQPQATAGNAAKRKQPPGSSNHRSIKRARRPSSPPTSSHYQNNISSSTPNQLNGQSTPRQEQIWDQLVSDTSAPAKMEWQDTTTKVITSIVSIKFCHVHSFETEKERCSQATGFVVDAKNGYILTNRHVVGTGPFWGYCIFNDYEEVDVYPVYRDPVHDFGFLKFDPTAIKYQQLTVLELRPDLAKVGVEIRVVGNDAGETLSILSGVISRLDRNAPDLEEGYNDFNTNYIQAASSTSGGSSGSPVINIDGHAVALHAAGAFFASTSFFLPLDRPLRALRYLQQGQSISRGTIQTRWKIRTFDECKRLGLTQDWERKIRKVLPNETSMLVAYRILPDGPAHHLLEDGDILIRVNGELVTRFIRLDDILDSRVGQSVTLHVQRGGSDIEVELAVGNLHEITPDRFVQVAGATFQNLSYQEGQRQHVGLKDPGVYCCEAAGSFSFDFDGYERAGWLISSIDGKPTPNLTAFYKVMKEIPDRARVAVHYKNLNDRHNKRTSIIRIDRHWTKNMRGAVRNDDTGLWDFTDIGEPIPPTKPVPRKSNFNRIQGSSYPHAVDIIRSFVKIDFKAVKNIVIEGYPHERKIGFGLVVDADQGLVVVSRAIVGHALCDITVTIANSITVDAKVLFVHPHHNYVIIQYDSALVQAPVKSAKLSTKYIEQGEQTIFFGFDTALKPVVAKTAVTSTCNLGLKTGVAARYRAIYVESLEIDSHLAKDCGSGVLVAEDGTVQALWLTYLGERDRWVSIDMEYHSGFATPQMVPIIEEIKDGRIPDLRILDVEMATLEMEQCRVLGVDEKWISYVEEGNPQHIQLFMVQKVDAGSSSNLEEGDVILTLNEHLITRMQDFDVMYDNETLKAIIVRKKEQIVLDIPTVPASELEVDRVIIWCGAILHRPHHGLRQRLTEVYSGIRIVAQMNDSSPFHFYGVQAAKSIVAVNDVDTPDLDTFVHEQAMIPNNTYFRLKLVNDAGEKFTKTLKKNDHYFPMVEYIKDSSMRDGWRVVEHKAAKGPGDDEESESDEESVENEDPGDEEN